MGIVYKSGRLAARMSFSTLARWEVEGVEATPPKGPLLVVCNHLSNADPPFLVASVPRRLHFLGKRSLFANWLVSHFLTAAGVHPLNRTGVDIKALRWVLDLLRRDEVPVLFPEGTRSRGGGMNRGNPGVAYVATKSQAPILPVAITGTENISGYLRIAAPLCRIRVIIGEPFSLPVIEGRLSRPVLEHLTDMIMYRIAALLPEEYKGYYVTPETVGTG